MPREGNDDPPSWFYRALFEGSPGAYLVLTPDEHRIVAVSDAYLEATRTARAGIVGRLLFEAFPADPSEPGADGVTNLAASLERVRSARRRDVMAVQRYPIPRPEAEGGGFEERFWSVVNAPVVAPDGSLAAIVHRVEDVTDYLRLRRRELPADSQASLARRLEHLEADVVLRGQELRRANERLAASESLARIAARVGRIGAWSIDVASRSVTWSSEVRALFERPSGDPPSLDEAFDLFVPEHRRVVRTAYEACVRDGAPYDVELQVLTASGRRLWVRSIGEAVRDDLGRVVRVEGAVQDVDARRVAQAELQLLRTAVSRLNDAIMITEAEPIGEPGPRIVYVNEAFERMTGYRGDEVIGRTPRLLQGPATERAQLDRVRAALQAWEPVRAELTNYRKDGSTFRIELDLAPIADATGWYTHWVAVERDVSERHARDEQVRQSQRLEAVGQLTGGVAHDFNNLLTVILGNAELLGELAEGDLRRQQLVDRIGLAAARGAELTRQLLAFARRQPLDPRPIDVAEALVTLDGLLGRTLGEHVEIERRVAAGLAPALVDPAQFENAILNLCLNARDAMPAGGHLTIEADAVSLGDDATTAGRDMTPGDYVRVSVSDTGVGIDPEHLPRIFDPFFTTKPIGKGSGLGLAMVYGFAKQSGGHVSAYSELGEGTTVRLYLPVAPVAASSERTPAPVEGVDETGSERVLVVEDDALVRTFAAEQLRRLGYEVIAVASGPLALDVLRGTHPIDLLFTDVVMPGGLDGRALADAARTLRPGLPVLFTSGYPEGAIVHHGRLEHGVRLLSKPYQRADLARAVREALANA